VRVVVLILLLPCLAFAETISVPKYHYLGMSPPCQSVAEARDKAVKEVASQILRTIGAQYSLRFDSVMTGTRDKVSRKVTERFHYDAAGFIAEIEDRIIEQSYRHTSQGVVYEILVNFPPGVVNRMRKLSAGAKVHAWRIDSDTIGLRELNGVRVILTVASVKIVERNRNADFLNYYVMKVSKGSSRWYREAMPEPVILENGAVRTVRLMVPTKTGTISDLFLGTRRSCQVTFHGTDEVGRAVKVSLPSGTGR
jgi:hypothetical protein